MADSADSRSLPAVTRRRVLSTSVMWLTAQVSVLKAASGAEPDGGREGDPVLVLWQDWMAIRDEVERLCRTQQRLESRLVAAIGFPCVDLIAPDQDHPVPAFTAEEIDRQLGDAPESAEARAQAKAVLAERQKAWNALDERLGYSRAKEAEAEAFTAQENLANALWAEPSRSIAGVAAKLHAILSMGEGGARDEFPWRQIRVVLRDIVGDGVVNPGI